MAGLPDLPAELLEQIFLLLETAEDMVSLASSSIRLHQVLCKPNIWRRLLAKAKMVIHVPPDKMKCPLIPKMLDFLETAANSSELVALLHSAICLLRPGVPQGSSVTVLLPLLPGPHTVSIEGLMLLALTGGEGQGPTILTVRVRGPGAHPVTVTGVRLHLEEGRRVLRVHKDEPAHLLGVLASLVSLQEEALRDLEVTGPVLCRTEEEGRALAKLLESCTSWRLGVLILQGGVAREAWQGLGRAAGRGNLEEVRVKWEVVGRGRREDVRQLWGRTRGGWVVEGRKMGWGEVEQATMTRVQKVKRVLGSIGRALFWFCLLVPAYFILGFSVYYVRVQIFGPVDWSKASFMGKGSFVPKQSHP